MRKKNQIKKWISGLLAAVLFAGAAAGFEMPITVLGETVSVVCEEGKEHTEQSTWIYALSSDVRQISRGTFRTGSLYYYISGEYTAAFVNEGDFYFDGGQDEFSTFDISSGGNGSAEFINNGEMHISNCYNFKVEDGGSLVNTGTIFLSDIKGFSGTIDNTEGIIVYDHSTVIAGALQNVLSEFGGTVMTKEAYDEIAPETWQISYELNGGEYREGESNPLSYVYDPKVPDDKVSISAVPYRAGYQFTGWMLNGKNIGVLPDVYTSERADLTLSAGWEIYDYTISYRLEGGVFDEGDANPDSYTVDDEAFTLKEPKRVGYTFLGWTGSNGTTPEKTVTIEKGSTKNRFYTANWEANGNIDYTVFVYYQDLDGGYKETPDSSEVWKGTADQEVTISELTYAKEGFTYDETQSSASGNVNPDGTLVLSLYYQRNSYQIDFYDETGLNQLYSCRVLHGNEIVYGGEEPQKAADDYTYTFNGWADEAGKQEGLTGLGTAAEDHCYYASFSARANFCLVTLKKINGFVMPESAVAKVDRGGAYTVRLTLENESYCVGTKDWVNHLSEYLICGTDEEGNYKSLKLGEDYSYEQSGYMEEVVLTIPEVNFDLEIIFCAAYHEHDWNILSEVLPTCLTDGEAEKYCYKCGKTVTETLEATKDISTCTIEGMSESYVYNGNEICPQISLGDGELTVPAGGYTVSYRDNRNAGTASVIVEAAEGYTGSLKKTFEIAKAKEAPGIGNIKDMTVPYTVVCVGEIELPDGWSWSDGGKELAEGKTEVTAVYSDTLNYETAEKTVTITRQAKPENSENTEIPEDSGNTESSENTETPEDSGNTENSENTETPEDSGNTESSENTETPEDSGDTESSENTETPGSSENIGTPGSSENTENSGSSENTEIPGSSENTEIPGSSENTGTPGSSENPTANLTEKQKKQVQKLAGQLGVSEATAVKIQAVGEQLDVPEETLLITGKTITGQKSDTDIKGSAFGKLRARAAAVKTNQITLKWAKVKGADGYLIYGSKCGKANKYKQIETVKDAGTISSTQKKLKKGTFYKYIVCAYKVVDGQKVTIAASKTVHAVTAGGKRGNEKSIKVNKAKVSLKKRKTFQIKPTVIKESKKLASHRVICYESSNTKVATVTKKGKIKAVGKGKCFVYVYAQNGVFRKISVTVK